MVDVPENWTLQVTDSGPSHVTLRLAASGGGDAVQELADAREAIRALSSEHATLSARMCDLRRAAENLVGLYVKNRGTPREFVSCITPPHSAASMTPEHRQADRAWIAWDALRAALGESVPHVADARPRQRYFVMRGDLVSGCTKAYAVISVDRGRVYESDFRSEAIASAQRYNGFTPADGLESTYERQSLVGVVGGEP